MRAMLVAIDGSDVALRALEHAACQASCAADLCLHVVCVQPPPRVYGEIDVYVGEQRMHELGESVARSILDDARERLRGRVAHFELERLEGEPGAAIARRAAEIGCESIVMGTHGRSRLGSALMGSVAQHVVHASPVPVTLVK
jgi:nucleotide-binding universal stress UspA family protein